MSETEKRCKWCRWSDGYVDKRFRTPVLVCNRNWRMVVQENQSCPDYEREPGADDDRDDAPGSHGEGAGAHGGGSVGGTEGAKA